MGEHEYDLSGLDLHLALLGFGELVEIDRPLELGFQDAEALRVRAFKDRRSESSIVREALRRFLKIED